MYGTPYPLKLELRVLEAGQAFKVEQCPHEVADLGARKATRDDLDADGMKKLTTHVHVRAGGTSLMVTFKFPGRYPVVNYMRREHGTQITGTMARWTKTSTKTLTISRCGFADQRMYNEKASNSGRCQQCYCKWR